MNPTTVIPTDLVTPLGAYLRLREQGQAAFLLESVERSERWGRYSFVGGDPAAALVLDAEGLRVQDVVRELPIEVLADAWHGDADLDEAMAEVYGEARAELGKRARDALRLAGLS